MKTIIVPVDFSSTSNKAVNIATVLAKAHTAAILLVHAYKTPVGATDAYDFWVDNEKNLKKDLARKLQRICARVREKGVACDFKLTKGRVITAVVREASGASAWLMVAGTEGDNSIADVITGTHTLKFMERSGLPVLVVPAKSQARKTIGNITFAVDFDATNTAWLKDAAAILRPLKPNIRLLHVSTDKDLHEETLKRSDFMRIAERIIGKERLPLRVIPGFNVENDLLEYLQEGNADLMVMSSQQHKMLQRAFRKSVTHDLVQVTDVPLLIFPPAEEKQQANATKRKYQHQL